MNPNLGLRGPGAWTEHRLGFALGTVPGIEDIRGEGLLPGEAARSPELDRKD